MDTLIQYVAIAFGWTWTAWTIAALSKPDAPWRAPLVALGGAGPALAASLATNESLKSLWSSHWQFNKLTPQLIANVAVWPFATCIVAGLLTWGFKLAPLKQKVDPYPNVASPLLFVGALAASPMLVLEELGWRACLLPLLQQAPFRLSPLVAGAVVGLFWALWHAPLFMPGPDPERPAHLLAAESYALVPRRLLAYICSLSSTGALLVAVGAGQSLSLALLYHAVFNATFVLWKPSRLQNVMEQATVMHIVALVILNYM